MKQAFRAISCTLLAIIYVCGYMGFGVHVCADEGTRSLVLLAGDMSCESLHHHHHCCECGAEDCDCHHYGCHSEHHDSHHRCCSTEIISINDVQDADNGSSIHSISAAASLLLHTLPGINGNEILSSTSRINSHSIPPIVFSPLSGRISVLRL